MNKYRREDEMIEEELQSVEDGILIILSIQNCRSRLETEEQQCPRKRGKCTKHSIFYTDSMEFRLLSSFSLKYFMTVRPVLISIHIRRILIICLRIDIIGGIQTYV